MKVLAIGETTNARSGWGRYASEIISGFKRKGIDYTIVTSNSSIKNENPSKNERQILLPANSIFNFIKNVLVLRKFMDDEKTVVHSFDAWPFAVYAAIASIGKRNPLFITGVGTYSIPPRAYSLKKIFMNYAYSKAKNTFCISGYTRDQIQKRIIRGNLTIVHWGVTSLPILSAQEIQYFKELFKVKESHNPIILTVGQIKHRKGQLDTLKAIAVLKRRYPNILYIMVGSTSDAKYVDSIHSFVKENYLNKNILIVNNQKNDKELSFFYSICDVFAMNSNNEKGHFEGFGLVFLEAESFGKSVVGSRDCGIEDAIKHEFNGYLSEQGDHKDISEKISSALNNKIFLGRNSLEFIKDFSWDKTINKYYQEYEK